MSYRACVSLVGLIGALASGTGVARAQQTEPVLSEDTPGLTLHRTFDAFESRGEYSRLYATPVDLRGWPEAANPQRAGDDVAFGEAFGAFAQVRIRGAAFGIVSPPGSSITQTDVLFSFYDVFSGWNAGSFPGAQLLSTGRITQSSPSCDADFPTYACFPEPIELTNNAAGADVFVLLEALLPGTTQLHPTNWIVASGPDLAVGSSDPQRWGDSNGDGLVQSTELNVASQPRRLYLGLLGAGTVNCDSIDFNNDGAFFDPVDIDSFLSVFSEGPCLPLGATCNDIDFNNDGSSFDPCDVDAFLFAYTQESCIGALGLCQN